MSLVTNSPVHSSSSDDFAAFLDAELDSNSSYDDEEAAEALNQHHSDSPCSLSPNDDDDEEEEGAEYGEYEAQSHRAKTSKVETLEIMENSEELPSNETCTHPGSFGTMCIVCGKMLDEESGVTFGYIHKGLRLGNDEIVRLRNTDMKNLLRHKKLYLVLDLDHTLLNSTQLMHMTLDEEYLKSKTDSLQDGSKGSLFMLCFMHTMTKLRPFVRSFLKEASQMFEMYICTMGDRVYASEMAKLLDPGREYFSSRVISRDDGTQRHQKGLDVVLGQESAVLILDDTEDAWTKHKENLILMERYHFFASSCRQFGFNCKSLSELKSDESESEGALESILKVLQKIHRMFFEELDENLNGRDVRQVLKTVRKDVLKGCKIVFSRVFPTQFQADNHHLWKMA